MGSGICWATGSGEHLEDVAVVLLQGVGLAVHGAGDGLPGALGGLLTGQPGAPRGGAAGAVADGAGEADPLLGELARAGDLDDGVAAHAGGAARVVDGAGDQWHRDLGVRAALVVAHEAGHAGAVEGAHAVQVGGGDPDDAAAAVGQQGLDADGADAVGLEAAGHRDHAVLGEGGQLGAGGDGGADVAGLGGGGLRTGHGETGGGGSGEEGAAGDAHGWTFPQGGMSPRARRATGSVQVSEAAIPRPRAEPRHTHR